MGVLEFVPELNGDAVVGECEELLAKLVVFLLLPVHKCEMIMLR